jgi:hypothetical protein
MVEIVSRRGRKGAELKEVVILLLNAFCKIRLLSPSAPARTLREKNL